MTTSVLVTGAGNGLGLESALHLASLGMTVYASVPELHQRAQVESAAKARGLHLHVIPLDVLDSISIQNAVNIIMEQCGEISAVVHSAGVSLRGYFEDTDDDEIRRTLDVNLFGAMAVTQAVLPHMRHARRGRIVFIGSIGGRIASMARTAYCASKFGLEGFAESLMLEVAPLGIRVSLVEPGIVNTERWTTNRGIARRAQHEDSFYAEWFKRQEQLADTLVRTSSIVPMDVATTIARALTSAHPQLRYVVGNRAKLVIALRRYLPGELFEKLYFGGVMARVTNIWPRRKVTPGSSLVPTSKASGPVQTGIATLLSLGKVLKVLGFRQSLKGMQSKRLNRETIRGYMTTRSLIALLNIGFIDELRSQHTVRLTDFATRHNLDPRVLQSLCDYLYSLKFLQRDGDMYSLDTSGELVADQLSGGFYTMYAYEELFYHLESLIRKEKSYRIDVTRRSQFVAKGSGEVGKLLAFPVMADVLRRNGYERILDLGCGDATFLADVCTRNERLTAYGLDLSPEAISDGNRRLERANLNGRVELVVGDVLQLGALTDQIQGIQAATCVYVLHEFLSSDKALTIAMLRAFKSAFPGIPLIVCEVIGHTPEELRKQPGALLEIQLFHNLSQQNLFPREAWKTLFNEVGFEHVHEEYLGWVRTAIYTVR